MPSNRRHFLARSGAFALSATLAGCSNRFPDSEPETVSIEALQRMAQRGAPTVSERLPVEIDPAFVDDQTAIASDYLADVPAPFDEEAVPNGVVRERLNRQYEVAQNVVDNVPTRPTPFERLTRAGYARATARVPQASWRAVDDDLSISGVREAIPEIRDAIDEFAARFSYVGDDPVRATPVLAEIEQSLRAARAWVEPRDRPSQDPSPFAVGDVASNLERGRFDIASGEHLLTQYRDSLSEGESRNLEPRLESVRASLTERVEDYAAELPEVKVVDSPERLVNGNAGDTAGVRALAALHEDLKRDIWRLTEDDEDGPRLTTDVLEATAAKVRAEGFASLRTRIEDGADLTVTEVSDVEALRTAAVEAVSSAQESAAPDPLVAALLPEFSRTIGWADQTFDGYEDQAPVPSVRRDAAAYIVAEECCLAIEPVATAVGAMLRGD